MGGNTILLYLSYDKKCPDCIFAPHTNYVSGINLLVRHALKIKNIKFVIQSDFDISMECNGEGETVNEKCWVRWNSFLIQQDSEYLISPKSWHDPTGDPSSHITCVEPAVVAVRWDKIHRIFPLPEYNIEKSWWLNIHARWAVAEKCFPNEHFSVSSFRIHNMEHTKYPKGNDANHVKEIFKNDYFGLNIDQTYQHRGHRCVVSGKHKQQCDNLLMARFDAWAKETGSYEKNFAQEAVKTILTQNKNTKYNIHGLKSNYTVYKQAFEESNGFFTDIRESDWKLMKERQRNSKNCFEDDCNKYKAISPRKWYQLNFEPTFTCQHERRIGGLGDGAKWVCDPHRIKKDCLVYSVGSFNNFDFEESVFQDISEKCEIHTFDPTVGDSPSNRPEYVHFHSWGLAKDTNSATKMKSLKDIILKLGHEKRHIDILKIDCEGCEWDTYQALIDVQNVRQIQMEMHGTTNAYELLSAMRVNNFVVFHKEPNTYGCSGDCIEYAWIKLNKNFFL